MVSLLYQLNLILLSDMILLHWFILLLLLNFHLCFEYINEKNEQSSTFQIFLSCMNGRISYPGGGGGLMGENEL